MAKSDVERLVCVILVDWININGELVEKGNQSCSRRSFIRIYPGSK